MKKMFARWLERIWYKDPFIAVWLKPFSMIYHDAGKFRRFFYRVGLFKSHRLAVPVIVVGNITVGGTGKTPFVIWLADYLKQAGYKPGIISRGYGGTAESWPQAVKPDSDPQQVGDEAILLAKQGDCPVAVGPSRVDAGRLLLEKSACNIILSDDGLQHYALKRNIEIMLIDGIRRFGNGAFLPGGPLREPISRKLEVDLVVCNGGEPEENEFSMSLHGDIAINLANGEQKPLSSLHKQNCHAIAGIGHPQRFFDTLEEAGLNCTVHIFPDHYVYQPEDIVFKDENMILMTEKDAVKCTRFANDKHWYVPVKAVLQDDFKQSLDKCLEGVTAH